MKRAINLIDIKKAPSKNEEALVFKISFLFLNHSERFNLLTLRYNNTVNP